MHLARLRISVLQVHGGHTKPKGGRHHPEGEGGGGGAEHGPVQGDLPGVRRVAGQDLAPLLTVSGAPVQQAV